MNATALLIIGSLVFFALMLAWAGRDRKEDEERQGWRIRCITNGQWTYEEKRQDRWIGIILEQLGDLREPPCTIVIPALPDWGITRRDQIVGRIKSRLTKPHFVVKDS